MCFWSFLRMLAVNSVSHLKIFFLNIITAVLSQWDFSHGKSRLLSLGKASCDSHATQPTVHAGHCSLSLIQQTLTWSTGSLMCTQMLLPAIPHRGVQAPQESLQWKLTLAEKNPCNSLYSIKTESSSLTQHCRHFITVFDYSKTTNNKENVWIRWILS